MCAGLATLADLASPVPGRLALLSLTHVPAKVAGAVLEACGKADELLAGERDAGQLGHPANFPGKLSVVLPGGQQPIRVFPRHSPVVAEDGCSMIRRSSGLGRFSK